jgi:hypothetical protein
MANWSYVWQTNQNASSCCGSCICMPVNPTQAPNNTAYALLANLDTSITTAAQAISHYGEQLRRRRGVSYCHSSGNSDSSFIWTMPDAVVSIIIAVTTYTVTYTKGTDTGTGSFLDIDQVLAWLVDILA